MKQYKRYKHRTNQQQTCATTRGKRVHHAHAVMCKHCVRHEDAVQIALSIQRPQEPVKEREATPITPPLPLSRGISRIIIVCMVTLMLGASLLFLSVTPYAAKSVSIAEMLAPIRYLPLWHAAVIGSLSLVGSAIVSRLMHSKINALSVRFS